jgi:uncharacterized CHY-type Zn-finger protein
MKLIVCEKCEAEYKVVQYYFVKFCTFCGEEFTEDYELQDEVELVGYDEEDD